MSESSKGSTRPARASGWMPTLLLAGIVLLGFVLRAYRLGEQSLWWDDYNGLAHLSLEGFAQVMTEARRMNPEGAPLYHVIQYAAAQVIGTSEYAQRMLNVCIGTAAIPVIFLVGRLGFGARAGLLAALLLAMSPAHIFHAQSLRIYPLALLLGVTSLLAMERLLTQRSARWLTVNAVVNGLLCMTHLFGLFGVIAQGVAALLVLGPRQKRLLLGWSAVQFVCLLPAAYWVYTMKTRTAGDFWHFKSPSPLAILRDLLGDDLTEHAVNRAPWPFALFDFPLDTPWIAQAFAGGMLGLFALVAAWSLWEWGRLLRARRNGEGDGASRDRLILMMCFWVLPVLLLVALAFLWWPVIYPRYTLYACTASYVLAGAMMQALPRPRARLALGAACMVLYGYQLLLLLPTDARTQWRQVARHIAEQARPNDIVLVGAFGPPDISHRTFSYHFPEEVAIPISEVHSTQDLMEQLRCHFLRHADKEAHTTSVWYVLNTHYYRAQPDVVHRFLHGNGLAYSMQEFPAEEYLALFRVTAWYDLTAGTPILMPDLPEHLQADRYDFLPDLQRFGFSPEDIDVCSVIDRASEYGYLYGDPSQMVQTYFPLFLDFGRDDLAEQALALAAREGRSDFAGLLRWYFHFYRGELDAALQALLAVEPQEEARPLAQLFLQFTLWAAGERALASASFDAVRPHMATEALPLLPVVDSLMAVPDGDAVKAALRYRATLRPHGEFGGKLLYRMAGLESWISPCLAPWSPGVVSEETLEAARQELRATPP